MYSQRENGIMIPRLRLSTKYSKQFFKRGAQHPERKNRR